MQWEKAGSSLEIRTQGELPDGRPALDEIVAKGAMIHLEQMSHEHWWIGIESGGKYFHLNFGLHDGRLYVHLRIRLKMALNGKATIGKCRWDCERWPTRPE